MSDTSEEDFESDSESVEPEGMACLRRLMRIGPRSFLWNNEATKATCNNDRAVREALIQCDLINFSKRGSPLPLRVLACILSFLEVNNV